MHAFFVREMYLATERKGSVSTGQLIMARDKEAEAKIHFHAAKSLFEAGQYEPNDSYAYPVGMGIKAINIVLE